MIENPTITWKAKNPIEFVIAYVEESHPDLFIQDPELKNRLKTCFLDFWEPYSNLYGRDEQKAEQLKKLVDTVVLSFRERPECLKELDAKRAKEPDWFQKPHLVGMMLYVDLFAGDLKKMIDKIPYLQELGINYVHLMPVFQTREGEDDGGYAVSSYRKVKSKLGTQEDLKHLAKSFHEHGISLVLDYPMNHTAVEHEWAQRALQGDEECQSYYFMFSDRAKPDEYSKTLPDVFPGLAPGNFTWQEELQKWVWTTFYPFQWDLDYGNPVVFRKMFAELMSIVNKGVDVVRLDAVPFLWKKMGTNCQNLPEDHKLIRAYRALVRCIAPGTIFKAEAIVAPDEIIKYLGVGGHENKECDLAYNATLMNHLWHALASESTHLLRTTLSNLPKAPSSSAWINYIRCHDDIGWGISDENAQAIGQNGYDTRAFCTDFYSGSLEHSYAEGYPFSRDQKTGEARISGTAAALAGLQKAMIEADELAIQKAIKRLMLLNNVIFSMKGIPLIYSGDEIGQLNDFNYLTDHHKRKDNRWLHRPAMDWEKAKLRKQAGTVEYQLFSGMHQLITTRKRMQAFHAQSEDSVLDVGCDSVFAVERKYENYKVLLLSNFSSDEVRLPLAGFPGYWRAPVYLDCIQQANLHFSFGHVTLPGYGYLWLSPTEKVMRKKLISTQLTVEEETEWGEELYIYGNIQELGNWNAHNAVGPLKPAEYPRWAAIVEVPENTVFEYKWLKKRNGQIVEEAPFTQWKRTYS